MRTEGNETQVRDWSDELEALGRHYLVLLARTEYGRHPELRAELTQNQHRRAVLRQAIADATRASGGVP